MANSPLVRTYALLLLPCLFGRMEENVENTVGISCINSTKWLLYSGSKIEKETWWGLVLGPLEVEKFLNWLFESKRLWNFWESYVILFGWIRTSYLVILFEFLLYSFEQLFMVKFLLKLFWRRSLEIQIKRYDSFRSFYLFLSILE